MSRSRASASGVLLALLCCASLCTYAAAQQSLGELLATFEAAYSAPEYLLSARESLSLSERQLENKLSPALSLRQSAALDDQQKISLGLELDIVIPLFLATTEPEKEMLRIRLARQEAEERFSFMEAKVSLQRDLLSTALLREVAHETAAALEAFHANSLLPERDTVALLVLAPPQRDLLLLERAVTELQRFAIGHLAQLDGRLQSALKTAGSVSLPPFQSLVAEIGSHVPPEAECLASAPARREAELRYEEQLLAAQLARAHPVQVDLHASASGSFGAGEHYGASRASIALRGRVPLPDGWPVGGNLELAAGSTGVDQQLLLNWPASIDLTPSSASAEHAAQSFAAELDALGGALRANRSGLDQARADVQAHELALLWLVRDVYGANAGDISDARRLAAAPFPSVESELHATQLRAQLGLARLAEAEQVLELRLACGDI